MSLGMVRIGKLTVLFFCILFSPLVHAYPLNTDKITLKDDDLWRPVTAFNTTPSAQQVITSYKNSSEISTLLGKSGAVVTKVALNSPTTGDWYVLPQANFIDVGLAFWQTEQGDIVKLADFSQSHVNQPAILMHGQAFKLPFFEPSKGYLWIYLEAKHYPTPVDLTILDEGAFLHHQFYINSVSLIAISVMLTLAILALVMFLNVKQKVALFCAGYVGLHGFGWAFASGAVNAVYASPTFNKHYLGMYLFAFAVSCAGAFTYYLFNFDKEKTNKLARALKYFSITALVCGVCSLLMPFYVVFYTAHFLAAIWVTLSLTTGFAMLSLNDFRAKYFLFGNVLYSLSLVVYVAFHFNLINATSAEIFVLFALAIDCVCILLSLSEWLKLKHQAFNTLLYESRFDPLTQVGNRLLLDDELVKLAHSAYIIVFIDCDGIKKINDGLGHAKGDAFLINAAKLMIQHLAQDGTVFRTGGDEFIWLCKVKNKSHLPQLKTTLTQKLNALHNTIQRQWPQSGISYGIASSDECQSHTECLTLADQRMYNLKSAHKLKVC
ncbi:diguanylate cyclase [Pseudoalteromonas sp. S3785]|uniref:sensor domain-containing diguanylate cyclase n=1 Tax=Pseudoalteromonas sp. S3785 TaxID=579545 RepID=UPI00110ACD3D|nr:diguanylate cyclase [Pseudoalteromonas sp. S3785]TMO74316.1 diguanylate cyclase [Pseudoalteromonas sp. S3785]